MKLSIIIPVYNVEKFLNKCLHSIFDQPVSLDEYEVIIVNDGSPDNSASIIEKYKSRYSNVKVINQENSGLSLARNNGLQEASGDFVWFVDSDDWLADDCLDKLLNTLSNDLDAVHIGQTVFFDDISKNYDEIPHFSEAAGIVILDSIKVQAQLTIYRREFLIANNLKFYPKIYHEDMEFTPRAYYFAKKVVAYKSVVYNYYQRSSGAITSSFSERNLYGLKKGIQSLLEFEMKHSFSLRETQIWRNNIAVFINQYYRVYNKCIVKDISEYELSRKNFAKLLMSSKMKYFIEGIIFSIFPKMAKKLLH